GERDQHVYVAMNNLEVGYIANGAFKAGILIAADDQGVDLFDFHGRADIFVTPVDFVLAGHFAADLGLLRPADFGGGESVHFRGVHKRFDGDLFPFGIARTAGRAVIQCFDPEASHYGSVRIPENGCMFGWGAEHPLVAGLDGLDQLVVLGNFRAGNRNENLVLDSVVWMFLAQIANKLFDGGTHFFQRHRRGNPHIEKNVRAIRRAANAPGKATTDATDIHDAGLAVVCSFALPRGNPIVNRVENLLHAEDRAVVSLSPGEAGVHIVAARGKAHPYRTVMAEHQLHVRGLAEDAHVRQNAVIDKVMRAYPVAAKFLADELIAPLRLLDFADNGRDGDVALQLY